MSSSIRESRSVVGQIQTLATRLGPQEFRRRLWHYFPGVVAFAVTPIPHRDPIPLWVMLTVISIGILIPGFFAVRNCSQYLRDPRENSLPGVLGYVLPLTVLSLCFRAHVEIPLTVAAIIAFGDGSATLVGILSRGAKIPWNSGKSWPGTAAFIAVGIPMATAIYWLQATPHIPLESVLLCVTPVVILSALVETIPLRINDNLQVGITAAVLMVSMQTIVIGWV